MGQCCRPQENRVAVASDREWADAFLAQGGADLAAADAVATSGLAPSSLAMLLQMAFEKLAKAALLRMRSASLDDVTSTHATAGRLLKILRLESSSIRVAWWR
jgi:hypothetical protein